MVFLVVSVVVFVVSAGVDIVLALSVVVVVLDTESVLVAFSELLHHAAIDPIIVATSANFKK